MLKGDQAPEFELEDDQGNKVTLSGLLSDGPIILYFYPADFTPICTAEACSIRDMHEEILDVDIRIIGVSRKVFQATRDLKTNSIYLFRCCSMRTRKPFEHMVWMMFGIGVRRPHI